ncbi:hypothetical protein [Cyanobium sp. ATX-6F1]|uniref:hypothetical protein n=1 Tax=Cyanobium sp. ATX-6F1 TaxID=3137388 RepID=UPI0039BDD17D
MKRPAVIALASGAIVLLVGGWAVGPWAPGRAGSEVLKTSWCAGGARANRPGR